MKKLAIIFITALMMAACSTATKKIEPEVNQTPPKPSGSAIAEENIDYESIQKSLGMDRDIDQLGYKEKAFNTCEMGFGFSRSQNCRTEYLAIIHFQLLCRDSQGTISTALTREDMQPLSGRTIQWTLNKKTASTVLGHDGHGQIRMSFAKSPRYQRLKLSANNDALYLKAGEIKRIVTPSNWCN